MSRIDIVVCPDKQYIMPTGVMICSVCANNPETQVVFHVVIDSDVSAEDCADLKGVVRQFDNKTVSFYPFKEELFRALPRIEGRITRATFFRLFLEDLLPSTIKKVLYLDGDLIVRHPLNELWNRDLTGYALAAVPDTGINNIEWYDRLGYSPDLGYFNAGVLLINLEYWRQNHVTALSVDYMRSKKDVLLLNDQDILNYVFCELKIMLPIKYNLQQRFMWTGAYDKYSAYKNDIKDALEDPVIIHYTEDNKPWLAYQRNPHPFFHTFIKYQNLTKWRGVEVENRSFPVRVRNRIGDFLRIMKIRPAIMPKYLDIAPID